ncbi:MAG: isochorismatase family protein [Cyanobacteria bacterium SZAS LIN-3]|nr:isochorismatase family protein [Cyanobacteria bacterium SZAS LIN-3]
MLDRRGRRPECLEERPGLLRRLFDERERQLEVIAGRSARVADSSSVAAGAGDLLHGLVADSAERTLVVVDAQNDFVKGASEEYFLELEALVLRARRRGWPIIFLEFFGRYGDTIERLLKLVDGYPRAVRVKKYEQSGVGEVAKTCREQGFGTDIFQLCGAYSDHCITATGRDLALNFRRSLVEIVTRGCVSFGETGTPPEPYDWFSFPMSANIRLVRGARKRN